MVMQRGGVALQPWRLMVPFFHFPPTSAVMWRWSTVLHSSPGCPWRVPLKTDQVPSGCSPDLWLLNCKLWCITGRGGANDFACIKHLATASSKGHFTTGARLKTLTGSSGESKKKKKSQRSKQACEKDLWLIIDWQNALYSQPAVREKTCVF